MSWSKKEFALALANMDVEDRAVRHLGSMPHKVAAVTAIKAALDLAADFEVEGRAMLCRNDPRPVFKSTEEGRSFLRLAAAKYREDKLWLAPVDLKYRNLFAGLYLDAAALVAYKVVRQLLHGEKLT